MCPVCIANAAAMAAGAASTGGVLAVCVGKFRKCFRARFLRVIERRKNQMRSLRNSFVSGHRFSDAGRLDL